MTDDDPLIPEAVLQAIEDLSEGNTTAKEEIEAALKFGDDG